MIRRAPPWYHIACHNPGHTVGLTPDSNTKHNVAQP